MDDREQIISRLRAASFVMRGTRYVFATHARRIIGVTRRTQKNWQRDGSIRHVRLLIPQHRRAPNGVINMWPLDQTIARVKRLKRWHRWTDRDRNFILEHLGTRDYKWIAKKLGVTYDGVMHQAKSLGVGLYNNDGLCTAGEIARLLRCDRTTICGWTNRGLKHRRIKSPRGDRLLSMADVIVFVTQHPRIYAYLDAEVRKWLDLEAA